MINFGLIPRSNVEHFALNVPSGMNGKWEWVNKSHGLVMDLKIYPLTQKEWWIVSINELLGNCPGTKETGHTHTNIGSFVCRRSIEHWTELIGTDASKHHSSPVMAMHDHSLSRLLFFFNFFLIFAPLSNISFTHWLWPIYLFDDYTLSCLDIGAHAHIYPNSSCLELIDCYNRLDSPYNVHSYLISLCRIIQ